MTVISTNGYAGSSNGSAVANGSGDGTIPLTTPLAAGQNDPVTLTLSETTPGGTSVGTDATASVQFDVVPAINGVGSGEVVDANPMGFEASGAIPNDDVQIVFTPEGAAGGPTNAEKLADSGGAISYPNFVDPSSPLAPGEYSAAMTTFDSNNAQSDASPPTDFFVAPAQPPIASLTDGEALNQSAPNVTVSGVLAGATVTLYTTDNNGNPVQLNSATATTAGNLTFSGMSPSLADGDNDALYAVQTVDEDGTQVSSDGGTSQNSPASGAEPIFVSVNTTAPVVGAETVNDGATTSDNQPYFDATNGPVNLQDGTSGVEFFLTGPNGPLNSGVVQTDGGGQTSWQPTTALPDGAYTINVRSVDGTGHVGDAPSNSMSFTVDTIAPAVPTVVSPADGSTITSGSPLVTVHSDAGSQMCVVVDPGAAGEQDLPCQAADGNGNATFALGSALSSRQHTLLVTASDEVGNTSENGTTFTVAMPTTTPAPTPTPTSTPTPTPKPTPAPQAPKALTLSSHTVSAAHPVKLGFSLSKPGTVTVKLMHTVHGKSKVVGTVIVKVTKAGKHSIMLTTRFAGHKLGKGSYTLSLQAGTRKNPSKAVKTKLSVH